MATSIHTHHTRFLFRWMPHRPNFYHDAGGATETVKCLTIQEAHPRDADIPAVGVFQLGRGDGLVHAWHFGVGNDTRS